MNEVLPKVKFKIHYPKKAEFIKILEEIQNYYSLDNYLFKAFPKLKGKTNKEISDFFINNKSKITDKLNSRKEIILKEWKEREYNYFKKIQNLTGFEWREREYVCYISPIDAGRYMLEISSIVCFAFDANINETINTISEELFHIHFWNILGDIGINLNKETFSKYWILSEALVGLALPEIGLELSPSWWGKEIKKMERKLLPIWRERNSFEEFLRKSINFLDCEKG